MIGDKVGDAESEELQDEPAVWIVRLSPNYFPAD